MSTSLLSLTPPSSPDCSPLSPHQKSPPVITTVMLTTGKCTANRCFCLAGSFNAPPGNPATLDCISCQHSFRYHQHLTHSGLPPISSEYEISKYLSHWCPRKQVVEGIFARMVYHRVLHIRGTPACGKTIVRLLLEQYIQEKQPQWFISSLETWPGPPELDNDLPGTAALLEQLLKITSNNFFSTQDRVLLIDEAQNTYKNVYFWNSFLKLIDMSQGVYVVLFSSYGSPGRRPVDLVGVTPPVLNPDQRISLVWQANLYFPPVGLLLDRDEATEVVSLIRAHHQDKPTYSTELIHWLFYLTGGHVGALDALVKILLKGLRKYVTTGRIITMDLVSPIMFETLTGESLCARLLTERFGRGLPSRQELQDNHVDAVFKLLAAQGGLRENDTPSEYLEALGLCYRMGWVHKTLGDSNLIDEDFLYVFPSPIHAWHAKRLLLPSTRLPTLGSYSSPLDLVIAIIRKFKPSQLSDSPRASQAQAPPEAQYGMELYRCCHLLLNGNILPAPEFGTKAKGCGIIDFFMPGHRWGFELTREGVDLQGHWNRFLVGGAYRRWINSGELSDWILLDFRIGLPRSAHTNMEKLYHVCFQNNYREVTILDSHLANQGTFMLLEV